MGEPPPKWYLCFACKRKGHWQHHCPQAMDVLVNPPVDYVCPKCNIKGHWKQRCPLNSAGPPKPGSAESVFVSGVSEVNATALRRYFEKYGPIKDLYRKENIAV